MVQITKILLEKSILRYWTHLFLSLMYFMLIWLRLKPSLVFVGMFLLQHPGKSSWSSSQVNLCTPTAR